MTGSTLAGALLLPIFALKAAWTPPLFTRPMAQVLKECGVDRRQVHYFNDVHRPSYAIHLSKEQFGSRGTTRCLDVQIKRRKLADALFYVQPSPDRK